MRALAAAAATAVVAAPTPARLLVSARRAAPRFGHCRASPFARSLRSACYASTTMGDETSTSASGSAQEPAAPAMQGAGSVKQQISNLAALSLRATVPEVDVEPIVEVCTGKFGDYQCNNAMGLWSKVKGSGTSFKNPNAIGQAIAKNLPACDVIESASVAGPGFVNIVLSKSWVAKRIQDMLVNGIKTWAPILPVKRVVLDFSSPNIAKEMHVGHLRSTIIGDTLARMFEFSNVEVLRRNHVGDWGTQFGMLIEFLFEKFPNWEELGSQAIGDLQVFYKASKQRFDEDAEFKDRAQQAVVRLQGGEEKYRAAWKKICEISRNEFDQVYKLLDVQLEEKGESFYNPYIPQVLEKLSSQGLIEESEGARVIFIQGHQIPLIVVKRDGGFNYASTDLAALWYRLNVEKAEWIIYVTDVGQQQHFDMFFKACTKCHLSLAETCYCNIDASNSSDQENRFYLHSIFCMGFHFTYCFCLAARMAGWLPDPKEKKFPKTSH
uniref:arginine--tRNA ligase n=1 Tax=Triticum urartu TaxID=4572 RepID=A0A8R7NZV7_TRIUA